MKSQIRVLGVMTGTSCDALDAACISVDPEGWEPEWSAHAPYPVALRKRVLELQKPSVRRTVREILELQRDLGEWYGTTLSKILKGKDASTLPDLIANHGQTVAHFPATQRKGVTLQMGDPTRIAQATGLTIVSNFRDGDMSAGGEGAPLAPLFHKILAGRLDPEQLGVAVHNIGGISNFTYVPPQGDPILAFDTGPGNIWMDAATELVSRGKKKFDAGGKLALQGEVDEKAVDRIMRMPYFRKAPPKSTGRDDFPFKLLTAATKTRGAGLVATATAVTIESIAQAYERFILDRGLPLARVFVTGGGAMNDSLMNGLQNRLRQVRFSTIETAGLDGQLIEAQAFAFFGFLSLLGQPLGGSWTGAKAPGAPGHIVPGQNWRQVLGKLGSFV